MRDLAARITASLSDPRCEPWFPELTECLTLSEWKRLRKEIGIVPETYSTARILQRSPSISGEIKSSFEYSSALKTPNIKIEAAQQQWANSYRRAGIRFYSTAEIENTSVLECISDALNIISEIPTLICSVQSLVRSLHVIKPPDADHDVSFSEPQIPFTIFVSVSPSRYGNESLRLAEAIVHEAMHLQLSLIEKSVVLCVPSQKRFFSPWREEFRPAQGILHGLYVFTVINHFLRELSFPQDLTGHTLDYVAIRRAEIARQLNAIQGFQKCADLTVIGSSFVSKLLSN
jgi:hypothetical protein